MNNLNKKEELKNLVLARLGTLNPKAKILLMGEDSLFSVKEMIQEVNSETPLGRKIIEVQYAYLKMLSTGEL